MSGKVPRHSIYDHNFPASGEKVLREDGTFVAGGAGSGPTGPSGATGPAGGGGGSTGPTGPSGEGNLDGGGADTVYPANLDGGMSHTVYGGIDPIDAGSA